MSGCLIVEIGELGVTIDMLPALGGLGVGLQAVTPASARLRPPPGRRDLPEAGTRPVLGFLAGARARWCADLASEPRAPASGASELPTAAVQTVSSRAGGPACSRRLPPP